MSYINKVVGTGYEPAYLDDVIRIQKVALEHGVALSLQEADRGWQMYSDDMCASWMNLPKSDDEVWEVIK